jgi:molecular chaperone DnaJ
MDLYEILGIGRSASPTEIRRAYQKLARRLHPALNPGDPVAAERFQAVAHALQVLSDPQRRAEYDKGGEAAAASPPVPDVEFEGFDFSAEVRTGAERVGFREIFAGVIRRPGPAAEPASPMPGEDLEQATRISFDESLQGTSRRLHLVRQDHCPICSGAGEVSFGPVPCPRCAGTGQVRASRGHLVFTRRCAECAATGRLTRRPCSRCGGEGRLIQSEWLDVQIPAGVGHGSRVRVPGCGNAGRRGGPPGDFVLVVQVDSHPYYRREGDDLHCQVPVTITEAALGAHVEVETPEGPMVIEIPAGTQTGQRFRLRKRGVPRLGDKGRGDLYVEVRVWVPTVSDDRSRALLEEFARRNPASPRRAGDAKAAPSQKG